MSEPRCARLRHTQIAQVMVGIGPGPTGTGPSMPYGNTQGGQHITYMLAHCASRLLPTCSPRPACLWAAASDLSWCCHLTCWGERVMRVCVRTQAACPTPPLPPQCLRWAPPPHGLGAATGAAQASRRTSAPGTWCVPASADTAACRPAGLPQRPVACVQTADAGGCSTWGHVHLLAHLAVWSSAACSTL
jgi:hypothetical protein